MAKLPKSFSTKGGVKLPAIGGSGTLSSGSAKSTAPPDAATRILSLASAGANPQGLNFGTLYTKATSTGSSGSQWTSLLSTASGGLSSVLSGGLLSSGGFGVISGLISLLGGGKSTPAAPVAFLSPVTQQRTLDITPPGGASSVALGAPSVNLQSPGAHQQTSTITLNSAAQSAQVVRIVKQALLTSSSLNDVIAEI